MDESPTESQEFCRSFKEAPSETVSDTVEAETEVGSQQVHDKVVDGKPEMPDLKEDLQMKDTLSESGSLCSFLDSFSLPAGSAIDEDLTISDYLPLYAATRLTSMKFQEKKKDMTSHSAASSTALTKKDTKKNQKQQPHDRDAGESAANPKMHGRSRGRPGKFQKLHEDFESLSKVERKR